MSWEKQHSWLAETSFAFGFPLSGPTARQSCSSELPWVAAASAYLWCHSSCELVNLWGKSLSLGMTPLFPPAPNSVLTGQHGFHCFLLCSNWICFGKSFQCLLSRGKLSTVIKPCLEVWEAEFSVLVSHCFLCAFGWVVGGGGIHLIWLQLLRIRCLIWVCAPSVVKGERQEPPGVDSSLSSVSALSVGRSATETLTLHSQMPKINQTEFHT